MQKLYGFNSLIPLLLFNRLKVNITHVAQEQNVPDSNGNRQLNVAVVVFTLWNKNDWNK